jgi:non-specific serine/threonine protein kinase
MLLTRKQIDVNNLRHGLGWQLHAQGKALYQENCAQVTAFDGQKATCSVRDKRAVFTVVITAQRRERADYSCTCSQAAHYNVCQHMIAATLALRDYLRDVAEKDWRYQIELALENTPPSKPSPSPAIEDAILLIGLQLERRMGLLHTHSLYAYAVHDRALVAQVAASPNPPQAALSALLAGHDWHQAVQMLQTGRDLRYVNLSAEANSFVKLLIEKSQLSHYYSSTYYSSPNLSSFLHYLPTLQRLNVPIFLWKDTKPGELLIVKETPIELRVALSRGRGVYELQAGVEIDGNVYSSVGKNLKLVSTAQKTWALADRIFVPIANPNALNLLQTFPLRIPADQAEEFRQRYFRAISERAPLVGEIVSWTYVEADPVPRLYLTKEGDAPLRAELRFGYGEYEVQGAPRPPAEEIQEIPGAWGGVKIHRQVEKELASYHLLSDPRYGLKRAGVGRPGTFELRARTHPFDFLVKCIPALTQAGFEIYGEKNIARINRAKPTLSLNITSGIDWFDIDAVVRYGDQEVSLTEIRKALRRGDQYIKLADGSLGQIPEEWLQRYKHLFDMAEETESGLRVSNLQVTLLDELLTEAEVQDIAPQFHEQRQRLQSFTSIAAQPLPQELHGELRPYQKAGYDWLHFLHQYGFGGILADDMGLGKTIQALALLQSLKERGELVRPALLVVPKSLLANWQREAARFTPGLTFLEYMGNLRKQEYSAFEQHDVILTTYGTMLRDLAFLRGYRFSYVILDESQAIKNPLAETSKAVRLLQADHRLCLTGTPVENNTFELWSQFAFLNPGLLGSLEYFKREFAAVIEQRDEQAQQTAQLLRRMIYPFILRRTKEQVAPELPPRSERILYTDLEPAQRKIYQHTRNYYRGLLLGMLEESDLNDIRMKILEGLLRLRQVCIHPQLVEPTYQGPSAKFELLLETMETLRAENHKALIFSQFVQTLTLLRKEMDQRDMRYAYLSGQTHDRQKQVDLFQNDPEVPFFLISLKAGGLGLNLTAADYVLLLDPWWNPAVEMQAADRAHRIGQDKPVFIYKFIARETVEEKILQLQERKRELVEQLISAEGGFFKALTKEDVQLLFS